MHIPGNTRNQSSSYIGYCQFNSRASILESMHTCSMLSFYTISFLFKKFLKRSCILEYVVDLSLEWRKVKNIFQSRPCSKVDVKAQLRDEGLFLFLKYQQARLINTNGLRKLITFESFHSLSSFYSRFLQWSQIGFSHGGMKDGSRWVKLLSLRSIILPGDSFPH